MIIFTSDNGSRNDFGESNGTLRGGKRETWEGGQRVPFIVHWKGEISPGTSDALITSLDLYPSLAAIAGAKIPKDRIIDGIDLSDLILGKTKTSKRKEFFYYLCNTLEAARVGDWKLHVAKPKVSRETEDVTRDASVIPKPVIDDDVEVRELYNLRDDPGETNNLYDEYPDTAAMEQLVDKAYIRAGLPEPEDWSRALLSSLLYDEICYRRNRRRDFKQRLYPR